MHETKCLPCSSSDHTLSHCFFLSCFSTSALYALPPSLSPDQNEVVSCQRRSCPVQCSHPVPSEGCCPACDSCLYQGLVHVHRHTFSVPSDPCQRCTCIRGTVTCVPLLCPTTRCARPVTRPGQCCPQCTGRMQRGGQAWSGSYDGKLKDMHGQSLVTAGLQQDLKIVQHFSI